MTLGISWLAAFITLAVLLSFDSVFGHGPAPVASMYGQNGARKSEEGLV